jgi:hypothetical protein
MDLDSNLFHQSGNPKDLTFADSVEFHYTFNFDSDIYPGTKSEPLHYSSVTDNDSHDTRNTRNTHDTHDAHETHDADNPLGDSGFTPSNENYHDRVSLAGMYGRRLGLRSHGVSVYAMLDD